MGRAAQAAAEAQSGVVDGVMARLEPLLSAIQPTEPRHASA